MSLPPIDSIDAVLLDLDDTILDGQMGLGEAWDTVGELIASAHRDLDPAGVRGTIAEVTEWFWSDPEREQRGRLDLLEARRTMLGCVLERLGRPDPVLAERAAQHYTVLREASHRLLEGALPALLRLRARFPRLALVTNGASVPQRAKIERFTLAGHFDHIQVEEEFGLGKPEPDVYHHVARVLAVDAKACLMVGDNYRADVLGALSAGMHAVWIDRDGREAPPVSPPRPHATVRNLTELADRLV